MANSQSAVIGIDLGGTKISSALFSLEGDIITTNSLLLEGKKGRKVGKAVTGEIQILLDYSIEANCRVESIGVCVPGIYNTADGTVWAPNISGWENYELLTEIKGAVDASSTSIQIESDRSCYILGEIWKGAAKGCENAIFMAVGTGIGLGIVANGHLITGAKGVAGAIGWMGLSRPYRDEYERCGDFEYHASGTGIATVARELLAKGHKSNYLNMEDLTAKDVFSAYEKEDPIAIQSLDQAIEYWGMAIANIVSIFNPEKIILGGGVFGPAAQFLDRIYQESIKWAQPVSIYQVTLLKSVLEGDAGLYGAGYLALMDRGDQL